MKKITIYGKKSEVALETINNVEEHYCTNEMFYVRAEGEEFYFTLEAIGMIHVETESEDKGMSGNIFENLTDEEQKNLWMYIIFNRDKIIEKTEQWTKEAEKAGMTLTEYLESINPLNDKRRQKVRESRTRR